MLTRLGVRDTRRLWVVAAVVFAACVALWHPARVAVQALLLLPTLFPSAPIDPLALITASPRRESATYAYAAGSVDAELFHPASSGATGGRHGAVVLLLGAGDLPRSDLAIHFSEALSRLGVVTLVPESSGMLAERLTFDEIDAIRASLDLLEGQTDVDPGRMGVVGLSASGGLAIAAAGQPDLRDRARFVNSFGSFADATSLLVDVSSQSIDVGGAIRPWQPEARTVEVVANALADAGMDDADRAELLAGTTRERANAIMVAQPSVVVQRLARVSPATYVGLLRAHLYLMHDLDDSFIPFTQSRDLVAHAPQGAVSRYTEFAIFAHVIPDRAVAWQTFLPDVWRLFWHVHAVLMEVL